MPAPITALASCKPATALAPPIGTVAEKRKSRMPKFSIKSSAVADPIDDGTMPSMSPGCRPASRTAASAASSCSARLLRDDAPRP